MTMPFYVSPEQQMRDRADYVRKNIARGKGAILLQYEHGIALVAENRARALHKISEIYDRIGFAAIGRYNEFEGLRMHGVQRADLQGYAFDRSDVTALMLANRYATILGTIFSTVAEKPYEVEIMVAEVGESREEDQIYRITYDGSVASETGYAVMGGAAEQISTFVNERYQPGQALAPTLQLAVEALGHDSVPPREPDAAQLEVAVLDRTRPRPRKFKRIIGPQLERLLAAGREAESDAATAEAEEAAADALADDIDRGGPAESAQGADDDSPGDEQSNGTDPNSSAPGGADSAEQP